jgi:lambda repressor-like predicted transcriptional regulator
LVLLRESLSSQNTPFAKLVRSVGDEPVMVGGSAKPQVKPLEDRPYRANRKLSTDELAELVECYRRGSLASELAERYGIHRQTVIAHLKREGVTVRPQVKLTAPMVEQAAELYAEGWSTAAIGKKYGVDASTVGDALRRVGVTLRGPVADRWSTR